MDQIIVDKARASEFKGHLNKYRLWGSLLSDVSAVSVWGADWNSTGNFKDWLSVALTWKDKGDSDGQMGI